MIPINLPTINKLSDLMQEDIDDFFFAAEEGDLPTIKRFISIGMPINIQNKEGNTALILASLYRLPNIVKELLNFPGIDVNIQNKEGNTALIEASIKGYVKVVKELLNKQGIGVNIQNKLGFTALMVASYRERLRVVQELLKTPGIGVNIQNKVGFTALMFVLGEGYLNIYILKELLNFPGIDINIQDYEGYTVLMRALRHELLETVKELLNFPGIDVNIQNFDGQTALIEASRYGQLEMVKELLNFPGIDINIQDNYGLTALMTASINGQLEMVKELLNAPDIDVNIKTKNGRSALLFAFKNKRIEIQKLLRKKREEVNRNNSITRVLSPARTVPPVRSPTRTLQRVLPPVRSPTRTLPRVLSPIRSPTRTPLTQFGFPMPNYPRSTNLSEVIRLEKSPNMFAEEINSSDVGDIGTNNIDYSRIPHHGHHNGVVISPSKPIQQTLVHQHHLVETNATNSVTGEKYPTHKSIVNNDVLLTTSASQVTPMHHHQPIHQPIHQHHQPIVIEREKIVVVDKDEIKRKLSLEVTENLRNCLKKYVMAFTGTSGLGLALRILKQEETLDEVVDVLIKNIDLNVEQTITSFENIHSMGENGLIISFVYRNQFWLVVIPDKIYVTNDELNAQLMYKIKHSFAGATDIKYHNTNKVIPAVFYKRVMWYRPEAQKPFGTYFEVMV